MKKGSRYDIIILERKCSTYCVSEYESLHTQTFVMRNFVSPPM
nr:MAG TPA: hypothetical protein [Caudoviricetes sp.]